MAEYTYAEFMSQHGLNEPVPRQKHIGLGGHGLGELQQQAGGLREALGREEDGVLQVGGQVAERSLLVCLLRCDEGIGHVRHGGQWKGSRSRAK